MEASKPTLLLVDDEPEIHAALRRTLRKDGYRILTTFNPTDVAAILGAERVDVLVSDVNMASMSGLALLAQARAAFPEVVRVLLTGQTSMELVVEAINRGEVFRYLTKPWDDEALREALRAAVRHAERQRRTASMEAAVSRRTRALSDIELRHSRICEVPRGGDGAYLLSEERTRLARERLLASLAPRESRSELAFAALCSFLDEESGSQEKVAFAAHRPRVAVEEPAAASARPSAAVAAPPEAPTRPSAVVKAPDAPTRPHVAVEVPAEAPAGFGAPAGGLPAEPLALGAPDDEPDAPTQQRRGRVFLAAPPLAQSWQGDGHAPPASAAPGTVERTTRRMGTPQGLTGSWRSVSDGADAPAGPVVHTVGSGAGVAARADASTEVTAEISRLTFELGRSRTPWAAVVLVAVALAGAVVVLLAGYLPSPAASGGNPTLAASPSHTRAEAPSAAPSASPPAPTAEDPAKAVPPVAHAQSPPVRSAVPRPRPRATSAVPADLKVPPFGRR